MEIEVVDSSVCKAGDVWRKEERKNFEVAVEDHSRIYAKLY
jgi:hypothetical protein